MPYFKNENINLLFIHIPKTGGSSLENYLSSKYNIPLNNRALYDFLPQDIKKENNIKIKSSLQHLTYNEIMNNKDYFNIDFNNINILTIIRNPYNRIISDLFFFKKINIESSKDTVFEKILEHLTMINDNHVLPQYLFITDENKKLIPNLKILRTESLTKDLENLGFSDYKIIINTNNFIKNIDYLDYLNQKSINLINNYYDKDFKIFNYKKI